MHCKQIKLGDVWKTCNKIRAAIFRLGLNLWKYYLPLDPGKNCLISESKFCSVLAGPLRGAIGLSDQEISELADYFRVPDGRIIYTQLCEVIHDSVPDFKKHEPMVTGLEWEDPLQVNRLSTTEERRLSLLLTKIAILVNMRKVILKPYFQDYELVSKNAGVVTIAHFARILAYLGIVISANDFNLLVKKYMKDGYTLNYVAFVANLDAFIQYMDKHGMLDLGGDILNQFPGKIIDADLPKLPRPEIGRILASSIFGKQSTFHSSLTTPKVSKDLISVIMSIQKHVLSNRLRINLFFRDFDPLSCGKVTTSQFHRALDLLGLTGTKKICLSLPEIKSLIVQYRDPCDFSRVCWRTFEDDIDQVFTVKELEKCPCLKVDTPPEEIKQMTSEGGSNWQSIAPEMRDLCEDAVIKVKQRCMKRSILLKPPFREFDKLNNGHVSRSQMRQCLSMSGILLSDEELFALEQRFNDDLGFNYFWFLREAEPKNFEVALYSNFVSDMKKVNAPKPRPDGERRERDIVMVLAKIKGKVVRERIRVSEFLRPFDRCNEEVISQPDFKRGLGTCNLDLTENEVDTIMEVFAAPKRCHCVDYKRFCNVVEEAFTQGCLERAPLIIPVQHVPSLDCERNFLNFEERNIVSVAMEKLGKKPDQLTNMLSIFDDYDKTKCGTVGVQQFLKGLSIRGVYQLISRVEFDCVCKCFGYYRGMRDEVDYRAFLKALDIIFANNKYLPNLN